MKSPGTPRQWTPIITRRRIFASAGAVAAIFTTGINDASAALELVRLDENDPTAKAPDFIDDANTVKRLSDRCCNSCALFAGEADDVWAGCSIFPGKAVASQGWRSVWASQQSS